MLQQAGARTFRSMVELPIAAIALAAADRHVTSFDVIVQIEKVPIVKNCGDTSRGNAQPYAGYASKAESKR